MISIIDQNFASPKRKDCKLDVTSVPSMMKIPSPARTQAKRNQKKSTNKVKKPAQAITKFFSPDKAVSNGDVCEQHIEVHANGDANGLCVNYVNSSHSSSNECAAAVANCENGVVVQSPSKSDKTNISLTNGGQFLSPEPKVFQNGIKQTTPHRIVCRSSPTKKQKLLLNDPASVFSNLNIRDGHSPKTKNAGQRAKAVQQKSCRKLNVNGTENCARTELETNTTDGDELSLENGSNAATDTKKPILNRSVDPTALENTTNNNKVFAVPNKEVPRLRVHETQMTDFFPIRRSGRKTKKTVEQELSNYIELAIKAQLEDGLVVKTFAEKGRGIVAGRPFRRGEFVVEYIGELINQTEADRREEKYSQNVDFGCYMYYFKHKEQQWW